MLKTAKFSLSSDFFYCFLNDVLNTQNVTIWYVMSISIFLTFILSDLMFYKFNFLGKINMSQWIFIAFHSIFMNISVKIYTDPIVLEIIY